MVLSIYLALDQNKVDFLFLHFKVVVAGTFYILSAYVHVHVLAEIIGYTRLCYVCFTLEYRECEHHKNAPGVCGILLESLLLILGYVFTCIKSTVIPSVRTFPLWINTHETKRFGELHHSTTYNVCVLSACANILFKSLFLLIDILKIKNIANK